MGTLPASMAGSAALQMPNYDASGIFLKAQAAAPADECSVSTLEVEYSPHFESAVAASVGRARSSMAVVARCFRIL